MAPLFGPLASAGANYPVSLGNFPDSAPAYASAPAYPRTAAFPANLVKRARLRSPIVPAPPLRYGSPFPVPSPVGVVGTQSTRRDRLFGPFASLGAGSGGPTGL